MHGKDIICHFLTVCSPVGIVELNVKTLNILIQVICSQNCIQMYIFSVECELNCLIFPHVKSWFFSFCSVLGTNYTFIIFLSLSFSFIEIRGF
jgi:hypothetical protein